MNFHQGGIHFALVMPIYRGERDRTVSHGGKETVKGSGMTIDIFVQQIGKEKRVRVRGHPLEVSGQVGAGIPFVLNFVLFISLSHDSKPIRLTASKFSLVAASTPLPESHQSPIRIKAWRRGLSGPWPLGGPRKPLVPRRVQTRGSQIQWLPDGSNLLRAQA